MNLTNERKKRQLSQQEVAKKLNISQGSYSNYENGKREPDINTLIKLSELFHTSIDNLVKNNPDSNIGTENKISADLLEVIQALNEENIERLENYAVSLYSVQKDEDAIKSKFRG